MALPTSGIITLNDIKAEFDGPNNLTAYYRDGGIVPDVPENAGVPTSGIIRVTDFYGATSEVDAEELTNTLLTTLSGGGAGYGTTESPSFTMIFQFKSNGELTYTSNSNWGAPVVNEQGEWVDPASTGVGSDYEIRFVSQSDSVFSPAPSINYVALSSDRTWSATLTDIVLFTTNTVVFRIREIADTSNFLDYTFTIGYEQTP